MRGFPAWPAMISEPEKWGFSAVRKKLFVYFYGTKQIAFCNYADIEAFTEEKKKSLLLKRQGKGADFVRAVDEIIDIYETSKKDNESNSGDDEVEPSAKDMKCVRTRSNSSSFRNSSELGSHKLEAVCDLIETNDTVGSEEVSATSTADDSEKNLVIDNPIQMMSIVDQLRQDPLVTTTTSRKKRLRDASPNSSLLQKRVPSLRRSRSSLIADWSKIQESTSVYDSVPSNELTPDAIQNENAESKSKQSLSHTLYFHDMDVHCSTGLPSNDCGGEVGTEMAAKDYENNKLNGCVVESSCRLETSTNGYLENKDRSNRNLKVSMKSLDFKKISKPNRKQVDNAAECSESNKENDLQVVLRNSPPNSLSEMKETIHKADGDEHLPLVKRARVRMGKSMVEETQHDEVVCGDEKFEASSVVNNCDEHYISFTVGNNSPRDGTPLTIKEDLNSSSGNNCSPPSGKDLMFWKVKKYHLKGSMLDVEAALPPSKRLHRALEAMSANATELIDDRPESPKAMEANISIDSSKMNSLHLSSDSKVGSPASLQTIQTSDCNTFATSPSRLPLQDLGTPSLVSSEVKPWDGHTEVVKSSHNNNCNEILEDVAKCNRFNASKAVVTSATTRIKCQLPCSSKSVEEEVNVASTEGMSNKGCSMLGKVNEDTMEDKEENHYVCAGNRDETIEPIIHKQDVFSNAEESVNFFPPDEAVLTVSAADMGSIASSTCGTTMSSSFQSDEDSQTGDMQGTVKQTQRRQTPNGRCISPDLTPMKALLAAAQAKRILSRSTSFSHNYSDGKVVPETISPSMVHKGDSSGHDSPPNGSVNNTFTVDDRVHVLQNGSRSPHISLHLKGINRYCHAEANTARKTFEALLCTLSRTKESIGRATRHAIDCAKYGMAGEVIELLLQNLEREQSLHKRVDLFFLVDSITQCSRNQKGGPGDAYPSLVQSVLPRLLSAAAPCGNSASENRRQCLKVLRLWLERKTLPESIIRQHMRELDYANELPFSSGSSRRPSRTERAINDPLREMEGMLVDEYGSNTNFQLPYLLRTNVLEDEEGNASEEKSFEAVTPERCVEIDHEKGATQTSTEKNRHVLEDVDVELEMEDVSPPLEEEMNSACHVAGADTVRSHHQTDQQYSLPFAPPLPEDRPPSPPPLPSSPPPVSPCRTAHVPQWQSGAHALADAADFHPSRNVPNMQNQPSHFFSQQPSNQNAGMMSSKPAPYYGPSYGCGPSQMRPPASVSYCSMPASHPSVHSQSLASTSLTDTGYHLQPPPPRVSSQFSYVQAESQQRAQPWGNCSFPERFQYVHDRHRGNFHGDKGTRGPFQHEMVTRSSFPSAQQPGPSAYDKIEGPSTLPPYGRPPEPPSMPSNGWSLPPRMSNYSIPASRPSVEGPTPEMAGACGYWRPR